MANGVTFSDDKTMAGITNAFNKRMSDQAQRMGLNIVFDTTGQNFRAVSSLLKESKVKGYTNTFAVIWAELETCLRRVASRNQFLKDSKSGRIQMPEEIVGDIYNKFLKGTASMLLIDYPVRADKILLYNNDTDDADAELLFSKEGRTVSSSDFSGFYNMDLTEVEPFIKIKEKRKGNEAIGLVSQKPGKRKTKRRTYKKNKRSKTKRRKLRSFK